MLGDGEVWTSLIFLTPVSSKTEMPHKIEFFNFYIFHLHYNLAAHMWVDNTPSIHIQKLKFYHLSIKYVFGELCVRCKGRLWCGLPKCPILEAAKSYLPKLKISSDSLFGISPPSIFVGRHNYPNVFAGPLVSEDNHAREFSDTSALYGKDMQYILRKTSSLLRASTEINVKKPNGRMVSATQEIAMSIKPLDTELKIEKIGTGPSLDTFFYPTGPRVIPRKIDVVDNPNIPRKVDNIVDEKIKANSAIIELYKYGASVDYLQRLLSAGILGHDKKMVPTRWSITAVDDAIGKALMSEVKHFETVDKIEYYTNSFMGNEFHILLIPGTWEYEMLETWLKGAVYASETVIGEDYEPFGGRKNYASQITGAYYSARLAVLEHLQSRKRQAKVLIYREITPDYKIPLGVWVIRETVRHAMLNKPKNFETMNDVISAIKSNTRVKSWPSKSKIVYNLRHQRTLDFFM